MSDERIIETADRWKRQEREDRQAVHAKVWKFVRGGLFAVFASWCVGAAVGSGYVLKASASAREARTEALRLKTENTRREQARERDLAWVECVNAIGVDRCTLIR